MIEQRDPSRTEYLEEYARKAARKRAKELYTIRGTQQENKDTFFRPNFVSGRLLEQVSMLKKERIYCGFRRMCMHMISKADLTPEEQETTTVLKNPTTVITANGTIRITEKATVYLKDLDMFVTIQLLQDSPAVLFLGKLTLRRTWVFL